MFILTFLIMLFIAANGLVVPPLVYWAVTGLAMAEALVTLASVVFIVWTMKSSKKKC